MTNREILDELKLLSPPADTIRETLIVTDVSVDSFAVQMEMSIGEAMQLVYSAYPITEAIAIKLEQVLKIDRSFWLNRERDYREKLNYLHQQLKNNA